MKKNYAFLPIAAILSVFLIFACSDQEDEAIYTPIPSVTVDLTKVPYSKLSDYHFFEGELKALNPSENVIPFEPASSLFVDYTHKKRFVWMPKGSKATYNSDNTILELPVGAALIKSFYYENVQNVSPVGATRIIETRIMVKKATGWIFANYIWNNEQTEAFYNMAGSYTHVSWKDQNNVVKSADYKIPPEDLCMACHRLQIPAEVGVENIYIPIGIKPQNLNNNYNYGTETKNQLKKWVDQGYLEDNFSLPSQANTTINYSDVSKPIAIRARSYVDANCAHCHQTDRYCGYRPMRFAFNETGISQTNMGVCMNTQDVQAPFPPELDKIVTPGNIDHSMMYYRMNTTEENYRMPIHGRTIIHEEGVALIREWINSLHECE